jgi:hypothetical protein
MGSKLLVLTIGGWGFVKSEDSKKVLLSDEDI